MTRIAALAPLLALTACLADPDVASVDDAVVLAGHQIVTVETEVDTTAIKQLVASCPDGLRALGAGWSVLDETGAFLDGRVTYSAPSFDGTSWMINARNASAWQPSWKLRVQLTCARVDGYQIVTRDSQLGGVWLQSVLLGCSGGKRPTGAGFGMLDATDAILQGNATHFLPAGLGWRIHAHNDGPFAPAKLRGFLVCAAAASVPGYQQVTVTTPADRVSSKQAIATCPGTKIATGAGWGAVDSLGTVLGGTVTASTPSFDGRSWLTNAFNDSSTWRLRTTALCVD